MSTPVLEETTVVIPTLGRPILERSLRAIREGSHWPSCVIVVDQGRRAEIAEMCRQFSEGGLQVEYVPSDQRGRARGLNRGVERVQSRFLIVTDDDCLAEPSWVHAMTECLRRNPDVIATGRIEAEGNVPYVVTAQDGFTQRKPRVTFDSLSGGNMGASREVLMRLGMFDEDPCVATAEDAELAYRALRRGVGLVYDPASGVTHVDWREDDTRGEWYGAYARSHGGFYGKRLRRGDLFIALRMLVHLARSNRHWLKGLLRGDEELARIGRAYALNLGRGAVAGWRSRSPIPQRIEETAP